MVILKLKFYDSIVLLAHTFEMLGGELTSHFSTPFPPASNFYLPVPSTLTQLSLCFQKWGLEGGY